MPRKTVSILRYRSSPGSMHKLISDCGGFEELTRSARVTIKPNLVAWDPDYPVAPYGVYTTTRLVEDLVVLLKESGAGPITIAEGSVRTFPKDPGTVKLYEWFGYDRLAKRHGIDLVDLVDGPFVERKVCGHRLKFAACAFETDFLINFPVFKTHNQTRLSLGLKNLKGFLDMKSRRTCHHADRSLDDFVAGLAGMVRPALTILDGIYGLERGPFALGRARRLDTLVASRDPLSVDLAAAHLAGIDPAGVPHLARCAASRGRGTHLSDLDLVGDPPGELQTSLAWDFDWEEDPRRAGPPQWKQMGFRGLSFPKYDATLCTGCSTVYNPLAVLLTSAWQGKPKGGLQVLTGKKMPPAPGFGTTLLVGNCMIRANRRHPDVGNAVLLPGCPPPLGKIVESLRSLGVEVDPAAVTAFRLGLATRYNQKPEYQPDHFYLHGAPIPEYLSRKEN
jgi:uncharacterized protein (DUF362 family)